MAKQCVLQDGVEVLGPVKPSRRVQLAVHNLFARGAFLIRERDPFNTIIIISKFEGGMAHIRQSRPDSGLGFRFQVKVLKTFQVSPPSIGSGRTRNSAKDDVASRGETESVWERKIVCVRERERECVCERRREKK